MSIQVMCSRSGRAGTMGAKSSGDVHHLVDSKTKRTLCNRDASDWLEIDADPEGAAESSHCCRRCAERYSPAHPNPTGER